MCGIVGFTSPNKEKLDKAVQIIHKRGPDGNGAFLDDRVGLGHTLLAITEEPQLSRQPVEFKNNVLAYNGEIYNYQDLKSELSSEYKFTTNSDTEVLSRGLDKYGIDFVERLDGMFAICLYDKVKNKLFLARDRYGVKPIFYSQIGNDLIFSSNVSALLECGVSRKIDEFAFHMYSCFGYVPGNRTMLDGVNELCPGEILEFDLSSRQCIKRSFLSTYDRKNFNRETLRQKISKSVKSSLMGRRSVGVFLSGGLDSSTVLYEASKYSKELVTFTTGFKCSENLANDDARVAKRFSSDLGINHEQITISLNHFLENIEPAVECLELPQQNKNLPIYYITNRIMSEKGIVVTLSGDGGDEIFSGYARHPRVGEGTIEEWVNLTKTKLSKPNVKKISNYLKKIIPDKILSLDPLNNFLYLERINHLCYDFLIRNDKLGMNFSMEGRFPLIMEEIIKYTAASPPNIKLKPTTKSILRETYRGILPDYIINKPKTGWSIPDEWLKTKPFIKFYNHVMSSEYYPPVNRLMNSFNQLYYKQRVAGLFFKIWAKLYQVDHE